MPNAEDERIRRRSEDIETLPLFDIEADETGGTERQRPAKSIAWGTCPTCGADEVGQVRDGAGLAWRDHYRMVGKRRTHCRASGTVVSDG